MGAAANGKCRTRSFTKNSKNCRETFKIISASSAIMTSAATQYQRRNRGDPQADVGDTFLQNENRQSQIFEFATAYLYFSMGNSFVKRISGCNKNVIKLSGLLQKTLRKKGSIWVHNSKSTCEFAWAGICGEPLPLTASPGAPGRVSVWIKRWTSG